MSTGMDENQQRGSGAGRLVMWSVRFFGLPILWLVARTSRPLIVGWEKVEAEHAEGRGVIFAFWHNRLLLPVWFFRHKKIHVLVSRHGDGELIAILLSRFGFVPVRGSADRTGGRKKGGARALYAMAKSGKEGYDLAFTPDGPRGPVYSIAPGLITLARLSRLKVVPVGIEISRFLRLKSWDRFRIPLPFCRAAFVFGAPVAIMEEDGETHVRLAEALEAVSNEAADLLGVDDPFGDRCRESFAIRRSRLSR